MKKFIVVLLSFSLLMTGCTAAASQSPPKATAAPAAKTASPPETAASPEAQANAEYVKITPQQAKDIMDSGNDVVILDVRTAPEFDEAHIENAVLLPDNEISAKAAEVLPDKAAEILVYCRSGRRSEAAARALIDMGYTNVKDFGGIIDWPYETVS